jgi:hypothetical protein
MLKINLQQFAEGELPGVETSPAAAGPETTTEATTTTNETTATAQTETKNTQTKTESTGETAPAAGGEDKVEKAFAARLAKERQKIETETAQKARDAYIAEQGYVWKGNPIKTEAEYKQALYEKELEDKGMNPDDIKKLVDEHPDVKAAREIKEIQSKRERENAEFKDFANSYPEVKPTDIPKEVWEQQAKGIPLKYAYADYALRQMKAEEAKAKANKANADSSTGSVNSNGNTNDVGFISFEDFEKNKSDQGWVNKNFDKIMKSRAQW